MRSLAFGTALLVLVAATAVGVARANSADEFRPVAAAEARASDASAVVADDLAAPASSDSAPAETASSAPVSAAAPVTPVSAASPAAPADAPAAPAPAAPAPAPAAPAPAAPAAPAPAPAAPAPAATPVPQSCAATWFCYPRLAVAGPIVPYTDCGASTDIGTAIRSLACFSDHYLVGHAYTQFGRITGFRIGDVVFAYGQRFVIDGSFIQRACEPPARAAAPLSLQTSLTSQPCGEVLVVTAR